MACPGRHAGEELALGRCAVVGGLEGGDGGERRGGRGGVGSAGGPRQDGQGQRADADQGKGQGPGQGSSGTRGVPPLLVGRLFPVAPRRGGRRRKRATCWAGPRAQRHRPLGLGRCCYISQPNAALPESAPRTSGSRLSLAQLNPSGATLAETPRRHSPLRPRRRPRARTWGPSRRVVTGDQLGGGATNPPLPPRGSGCGPGGPRRARRPRQRQRRVAARGRRPFNADLNAGRAARAGPQGSCKHHRPNYHRRPTEKTVLPRRQSGGAGARRPASASAPDPAEDAWFEDVAETLAETGAEIVLVPNGSPYHPRQVRPEAVDPWSASVIETGLPLDLCQSGRRAGTTR